MPLLDHFHPPLSEQRHWEGFHSTWASSIAHQLNDQLLPPRYFAEPHVRWGRQVEIDVATFDQEVAGSADEGGVTTAVWSPPRPAMTANVDFAEIDVAEIQVVNDEAGPTLVAAIELVSPANKDRPSHRKAFAIKCAGYLQKGVSVVIVDIVTSRTANLHNELLQLLQVSMESPTSLQPLYAVAFRVHGTGDDCVLDAWPELLGIGSRLPTLPLWFSEETSLPLDLDESYLATCQSLRINGAN